MSSLPPSAHNDAAKPRFDAEPELVNAAIAASARTRRIMFFSQVFGLVVLVVFFNTQFPRWARDRRRIVSAAQVLFRCAAPDRDVVYDSSPPPAAASDHRSHRARRVGVVGFTFCLRLGVSGRASGRFRWFRHAERERSEPHPDPAAQVP